MKSGQGWWYILNLAKKVHSNSKNVEKYIQNYDIYYFSPFFDQVRGNPVFCSGKAENYENYTQ